MLKDYFLIFLGMLFIILGILFAVAYLTLLERKVLGYIQIRKGPNKLGLIGLLQPFSDGIKLFSKGLVFPFFSNYLIFYFSPVLSFILSLFLWLMIPYYFNFICFNLGFFFLFCCSSVSVYTVMISGWASNSMYAMLGSLRSLAQTISYEVSMILLMLSCIILVMDFNMLKYNMYQNMIWFLFLMFPLCLSMFSSMLAETNRSPFDFAEGESELVSGFNVEYGGGGFSLIFLAEYSNILFMSMLFIMLYLGGYNLTLMFYLKLFLISFIFIWVRGTFPRYRYDKLMYLAWKIYLPLSLNYLMFFIGSMIFFF